MVIALQVIKLILGILLVVLGVRLIIVAQQLKRQNRQ